MPKILFPQQEGFPIHNRKFHPYGPFWAIPPPHQDRYFWPRGKIVSPSFLLKRELLSIPIRFGFRRKVVLGNTFEKTIVFLTSADDVPEELF